MTEIIKPDAFRGGIQSNLDKKLTDAQLAEGERRDKRIEFIQSQYKKAEEDEKAGTEQPDVIYSGFQRDDVYTADKKFDRSREAISDMKSLPVKQYGISPDGDFEVHLDAESAALEEVRNKKFCIECGDRQPDMPELWQHAADRLRERIQGDPPGDFRHGERCCYCGSKLGLGGDFAGHAGFHTLTPDQARLLKEMFGSIEGVTDGDFAKA